MENTSITSENFDLNKLTCNNLESLLSAGKKDLEPYVDCNDAIEKKKDDIVALEKINQKLNSKSKVKGFFIVAIILVILDALLYIAIKGEYIAIKGYPDDLEFLILPIVPAVVFTIIGTIITITNRIFKKQNKTVPTVLQKSEAELSELMAKKERIIDNFTAIPFIPEDYCSEYALTTMLQYIKNGRADNWKEVTALYEEHLHRMTMEENAKITAQNSILQTDLAKETRNATRSAASGAWVSAAGIWWN